MKTYKYLPQILEQIANVGLKDNFCFISLLGISALPAATFAGALMTLYLVLSWGAWMGASMSRLWYLPASLSPPFFPPA